MSAKSVGAWVSAILALSAAATAAQAQSEPAGLEEIVVTAQKRAENLQVVPISVTAVTAAALEQTRAFTLEGLQGSVPNVQIGHFANTPHNAVFNIRGMGTIEPDPYAGNTVSIVVDGVPQYFNMVALLDLYDIERIEILRGPQGTLFGANTTGGVVNVVTKQPTGEWGGDAMVNVGNYSRFDVNASLNFPLIDGVLAGKVAVLHHGQEGFYTNVVDGESMGDQETTALRTYLKYMGSDNFDATLSFEWVRSRNGGPAIVNGGLDGELSSPTRGIVYPGNLLPMYESPCKPNQRCKAPKKYFSANGQVPNKSDFNSYSTTLTMNWETGLGDVTSITNYKDFNLEEYSDQDYSPIFIHDTFRPTKGWQFSQELRDNIQFSDRFTLQVGGLYFLDHFDHVQNYRQQFWALFGLDPVLQVTEQDQDNWSGSVFAQGYYKLTDKLTLQAGARFTHEHTKMTVGDNFYIFPGGQVAYNGGTYRNGFRNDGDLILDYHSAKKSWDELGGKAGLNYQVTDDVMLFAFYAHGFKSGGFVGRIVSPDDIGPYSPETVDSIEGGIKSDWLDNRLRLNLSVFHNWYKDMQLALIRREINDRGENVNRNSILNAASARIKGFELEIEAAPIDGLTLNASLAYLDAKYRDFEFPIAGTDPQQFLQRKGTRLQNAPKWGATAGANYRFPAGTGKADIGAQYRYTGKKYNTSLLNTARSEIQPTHIVDANIAWMPDHEKWELSIWARNLFDNRYVSVSYDSPGFFALVGYLPPREYGMSFKYKW